MLSGLRVLLVEDDPDGRELFAYTLATRGASVAQVGTVEAALGALDRLRFDVLVSDIGLPDESGYSLMQQVRARDAHEGGQTPALAVTAYSDRESRAQAFAAGFQAFVVKPVDIEELAGVVAMVARRVEDSRRLLAELTAHAEVHRELIGKLKRVFEYRERRQAENRRLRAEARRLHGRSPG